MIETPTATPRSRAILAAIIAAALVAIVAIGVGVFLLIKNSSQGSFQINGTVLITGTQFYSATGNSGEACQMLNKGYDDLPGAQVVVTDAASTVIATGQLDSGYYTLSPRGCRWSFRVTVPDGGDGFYGVEVSHRGRLQYSREQLVAGPLQLTLN